jgi:hypothetical protein
LWGKPNKQDTLPNQPQQLQQLQLQQLQLQQQPKRNEEMVVEDGDALPDYRQWEFHMPPQQASPWLQRDLAQLIRAEAISKSVVPSEELPFEAWKRRFYPSSSSSTTTTTTNSNANGDAATIANSADGSNVNGSANGKGVKGIEYAGLRDYLSALEAVHHIEHGSAPSASTAADPTMRLDAASIQTKSQHHAMLRWLFPLCGLPRVSSSSSSSSSSS